MLERGDYSQRGGCHEWEGSRGGLQCDEEPRREKKLFSFSFRSCSRSHCSFAFRLARAVAPPAAHCVPCVWRCLACFCLCVQYFLHETRLSLLVSLALRLLPSAFSIRRRSPRPAPASLFLFLFPALFSPRPFAMDNSHRYDDDMMLDGTRGLAFLLFTVLSRSPAMSVAIACTCVARCQHTPTVRGKGGECER